MFRRTWPWSVILAMALVASRAGSQSVNLAELGPDEAELFRAGLAAQQNRDLPAAERSYRTLLATRPDFLPARLDLGIVLDAEGRTVDALDAFDAVRSREPAFPAAQMFAGIEQFRLGKFQEAVSALHLATEQSASDSRCWFWLARANFALGKTSDGKAALDKALAISPGDASALYLLAQYQISAQDLNGAERVLAGLVTRDPRIPDFHQSLGSVYYMEAMPDKAEAEYRTQLQLDADNPQALSMIGVILLDRGQAKEAMPYLAKGLDANPRIAYLQRKMGQALLESGQPDQAVPHLRQAATLDAQEATAHFLLWKAFTSLDRKPEAAAELETFRKLQMQTPAQTGLPGIQPLNPGPR
jgi:predicted Zn-dependent protease